MTQAVSRKQAALLRKHPLTSLNLATSRRYAACRSSGGHSFSSGRTVMRDLGGQGLRYVTLAVCDACDVPIAGDALLKKRSSMRVVA